MGGSTDDTVLSEFTHTSAIVTRLDLGTLTTVWMMNYKVMLIQTVTGLVLSPDGQKLAVYATNQSSRGWIWIVSATNGIQLTLAQEFQLTHS